jgi:phosphate starvation-inducible PhoH-like protein
MSKGRMSPSGNKKQKSSSHHDKGEDKVVENLNFNHNGFKLREIVPLNDVQRSAFETYFTGQNLCLAGSAGTGKTFMALFLALNDLLQNKHEKVIIVRSAVTTRDQGFLPGNLQEKMQLYEMPYGDIVEDLFKRGDAYEIFKKKGFIEFMSTSFIRGLNFDNAVIIIDEAQNLSLHEISSVLTRVGKNCRIIICGDTKQNDLLENKKNREKSGFDDMIAIAGKMKRFSVVEFGLEHIVRSGFVREFLIAKTRLNLD